MNFGVEIRNTVTGRAVTLIGKQAVADFLAGVDASEWEGYKCLGELPPATRITTVDAPMVDTSVNPVVGEPVDLSYLAGSLTLSVGDSGAGDRYLPADAAGEQA